MVGGTGIVMAHTAKVLVTDFLSSMSASADVLAMAQLEVELDSIAEGKNAGK
jgi:ubiquinol-cytochrome c reductase iron-sulfur subunit